MNKLFKGLLAVQLALTAAVMMATPAFALEVEDPAYYEKFKGQNRSINVHNWGEYISDGSDESLHVIAEFEALTGIKVNYTTFATNEELYARMKNGGTTYDVTIPSDYMVQRMIREGMLEPLDYAQIPNVKYISEAFRGQVYDPEDQFSVPYTWGTVGVIYNKTMVDEEDLGSWDIFWNTKYMGQILMFSNPRDAFGIALKRLDYPMNPSSLSQLAQATEEMKKQKLLVQAYVMDEVFDKMLGGEAALAPYYAGDAITMMADNPDLGYFVPEEGTNRFIDAVVIPKGSRNRDCAQLFINFLLEPEVAAANAEYIGYSTPNTGALELLPPEVSENPVAYPSPEVIAKTELWVDLPQEMNIAVDKAWTELLSADEQYSRWLIPIMMLTGIAASIVINILRSMRKQRERESIGITTPRT